MDGFRAEIAAVSGLTDAAEWRRRTDAFIGVDPNHSGSYCIRYAMPAAKVASPQPASETVLRGVRNLDHFLFILERRNCNEWSEDFFLAHSILRFCRDDRRLDVASRVESRIRRWLPTRKNRAALLLRQLDVAQNAIAVARGCQRAHFRSRVQGIPDPYRFRKIEKLLKKLLCDLLLQK